MDGVTDLTVWRTDEPCPVCGTGLFIVGYGEPVQVAECRLCGWSERWDLRDDATADNALGMPNGSPSGLCRDIDNRRDGDAG